MLEQFNLNKLKKLKPEDILKLKPEDIFQRKDIFVFIGILIISLFIAKAVHTYQKKRIASLKSQISYEEQRDALGKELSSLDSQISEAAGPYAKKDLSSMVDSLREFALSAGLKIISIKPGSERPHELGSTALFDLVLEANYHNLGNFISIMESQKDLFEIEIISLRGVETRRETNISGFEQLDNLSVKMTISVKFITAQ